MSSGQKNNCPTEPEMNKIPEDLKITFSVEFTYTIYAWSLFNSEFKCITHAN